MYGGNNKKRTHKIVYLSVDRIFEIDGNPISRKRKEQKKGKKTSGKIQNYYNTSKVK